MITRRSLFGLALVPLAPSAQLTHTSGAQLIGGLEAFKLWFSYINPNANWDLMGREALVRWQHYWAQGLAPYEAEVKIRDWLLGIEG
jgi:hypothetical protein